MATEKGLKHSEWQNAFDANRERMNGILGIVNKRFVIPVPDEDDGTPGKPWAEIKTRLNEKMPQFDVGAFHVTGAKIEHHDMDELVLKAWLRVREAINHWHTSQAEPPFPTAEELGLIEGPPYDKW